MPLIRRIRATFSPGRKLLLSTVPKSAQREGFGSINAPHPSHTRHLLHWEKAFVYIIVSRDRRPRRSVVFFGLSAIDSLSINAPHPPHTRHLLPGEKAFVYIILRRDRRPRLSVVFRIIRNRFSIDKYPSSAAYAPPSPPGEGFCLYHHQ